MKVWVVTTGEPLPVDSSNERLLRSGILCQVLVDLGHDVTWWTSTFIHAKKVHVFDADRTVSLGPNQEMKLLLGRGYRSNVSLARLVDHWIVARKFLRQGQSSARPDIILCSLPTIELSAAAIKLGKKFDCPVVLDVRDLWPDIFANLAPWPLAPLVTQLLRPYSQMATRALRQASAIVAVNEGFVDWGLRRAGRARGEFDRSFPMGYPAKVPPQDLIEGARDFWRQKGLMSDDRFLGIFVGTIGRQFEFEALAEVARQNQDRIRFVICGAGDSFDYLASLTKGLDNFLMPGWVGAVEIWTLMRIANVGLAPYHAEESFTHSLPNKSLEYLSAGLPVVSSLPGALERLLRENNCGLTYANNDAADLDRALKELMTAPETVKSMGDNARRLFNENFSAERVYPDMVAYLENVARAHKGFREQGQVNGREKAV